MSDSINRQDAIDDLHGKDPSQIWDTADVEIWINELPSAEPERKGKWIDFCGSYQCSCCNITNAYEDNFCPNCGADMRQPATPCTDDYCEREKEPQDEFTKWAKSVADSYRKYFI